MYSKDQLNSKKSISFSESVARRVLGDISLIEGFVSKRSKKRDLKVNITDKLFELHDNTISYTGLITSNSEGHYLSIDAMKEIGENGLVKITMKGTKRVEKVEIEKDENFSSDDLEMLEDMILVATNNALEQIEKKTEAKMGKYTKGIPGLF